MNWNYLKSTEELEQATTESSQSTVIIFKHSTRCSISSMALSRLERSWDEDQMVNTKPYYLDLITYRDISNEISEKFGIEHQSPQIIVLKNGQSVYDSSHMSINYNDLVNLIQS